MRQLLARLPALCLAALVTAAVAAAEPPPSRPAWALAFERELAAIDAQDGPRIGVWARDLDSGVFAQFRGEQRWYLASMVKLPVAVAVLRGVDRGAFGLDTAVTLRASDYVDGAGPTQHQPVGAQLPVRWLLEQMIVLSDNTATDVLIDLVGIAEVNAVLKSIVAEGFEPITSLADTRRLIYARIVPGVEKLSGQDLLRLRAQTSDAERVRLLGELVGARPAGRADRAGRTGLDQAYDAYYATGLNSARLDAYAALVQALADGRALSPASTGLLLAAMERVSTGPHRIKAGLPAFARWQHKTGTQRRRVCDAGIVRWAEAGRERRVALVACTRDEPVLERAEAALQQVGAALCRSGLFADAVAPGTFVAGAATDATPCPPPVVARPSAAREPRDARPRGGGEPRP